MRKASVVGIDLFCGAGGLTYGLRKAGVRIAAGIDLDPHCEYPFTVNNHARFIMADVGTLKAETLQKLYPSGAIRLLAGCAPCRPFSPFRRGAPRSHEGEWELVDTFGRLIEQLRPDLITMENVPRLASRSVFKAFVKTLRRLRYHLDWRSVDCRRLGVPQRRRRLVLLASSIGPVTVPVGTVSPANYRTVRQTIARLPAVKAGEFDPSDPLHRTRAIVEATLQRLRASRPGGTWEDWTDTLRAPCHKRKSGASYRNVYSRMVWDEPAPTITTQAQNFGTGRFGHPEQDRPLTLREAALLQTFPRHYRFTRGRKSVFLTPLGRLIGNAVPPRLGLLIGKEIMRAATAYGSGRGFQK